MRTVPCLLALLAAVGTGLADVDNLRLLGHNEVNRNHEMDVELVGNRAYVACGFSQGIECYDISNRANPQRTWLSNGPNCWRLRAYGDTWLFAFCRREGVVLFDISGPGDPVRLGQYDPPGNREALEGGALVGTALYAAAHQNGIYAIDFSNPASPQKTAALSLDPSQAWNVEALDSFLFVANGREGLAVVGLQGGMHVSARMEFAGCANDIVLDGDVAVLSLGPAGLATVDLTYPNTPVLGDTTGTTGCAWGIGIAQGLVATGSWRWLEVFDVGDPDLIARVGWDNTQTWAHGADIDDSGLVVVADWRGMSVYDLDTDPGPDIEVVPEIVDFGTVGAARETTVVVWNTGNASLNVSSILAPNGITVNPQSFSVWAGYAETLTIAASGANQVRNTARLRSNDVDETLKTFRVYKNNTGFPQAGSVAPDFTLTGLDGLTHSLSDYRGRVVYLDFGASW